MSAEERWASVNWLLNNGRDPEDLPHLGKAKSTKVQDLKINDYFVWAGRIYRVAAANIQLHEETIVSAVQAGDSAVEYIHFETTNRAVFKVEEVVT